MNAITQMITQQVAGAAARSMAQRLGVSEATAQRAVQIAVPLIVAALARNAAQPGGAQELHQAVNNDHDGSIFGNLLGYFNNQQQTADGAGILGHVLGKQQAPIQNNLAQAAGLDPSTAGSILEMVAPLVMGAVGQAQQQNNLDAGGLSQYLDSQKQEAEETAPDLMGALNSMLDSNRDGSSQDDVGRLLGSFFIARPPPSSSARRSRSRASEAAFDVSFVEAEYDGAAVRAGRGRGGLQQARDEPAHLLFGERSVHFHRGAARERDRDALAYRFGRAAAPLGVNGVEDFGEEVSGLARGEFGGDCAHRDRAAGEAHEREAEPFEFFGDFVEGGGLRGREVEGLRDEQVLRLDAARVF